MIATMEPNLQKSYEDYWPYEMNFPLAKIFHKKARKELYEVVNTLMECMFKEGESMCAYVQQM